MRWYYWENGGYKGVFFGKYRRTPEKLVYEVRYEHRQFLSVSSHALYQMSGTPIVNKFIPNVLRVASKKEVEDFKFGWIRAAIENPPESQVESAINPERIVVQIIKKLRK